MMSAPKTLLMAADSGPLVSDDGVEIVFPATTITEPLEIL
jgi:hypothetical protein